MVEIVQNKSWPNFHQLNKFYGTYVDLGVRESCGKTNTYVFFWLTRPHPQIMNHLTPRSNLEVQYKLVLSVTLLST